MRTLTEQLSQYALYHRDPRNIATHFIGIPMIVAALLILLSRPELTLGDWPVSAATLAGLAATAYYLILDKSLGLLMGLLLALGTCLGHVIAQGSIELWLSSGIGMFVIGWIIQFIGHYYEGKKPAFVDDIMGLVIGPLFVTAEALFLLGLRPDLQHDIEQIAGPVQKRQKA